MTAQARIESKISHLTPIMAAIAATNPHDADVRALSIDPARSVALLAPAGSGKTTQLLYRLLACLTVVQRPEEILAITFTNKAAGEIVERVTGALALAASGREPAEAHEKPLYMLARLVLERDALLGWNLALNPSRLRIMTFDAFCAQIAGKMPIMSGLGGGRTSDDPSLIYRAAILNTLGSVNDESIPSVLREALEAVLAFARNQFELLVPMFTTLLIKRDQWVGELLNMSGDELSEALREIVETEMSGALAVLDKYDFNTCWSIFADASGVHEHHSWAAYGRVDMTDEGRDFARRAAKALLKTDNMIRSKVTAREGFPAKEALTSRMNGFLGSLTGDPEVDKALILLRDLPDPQYPAESARMMEHLTVILRYLMANLMLAFDGAAAVDFPEVAQRAILSLGAGVEIGDALLDEDRVCHLLVDENQDTSPAQYQLLRCLVQAWEEDDERSVFMCGDKYQSIYLFRGATVNLFTDTVEQARFGTKRLDVYHLRVNFRSSPTIVEWNNKVYGSLFQGAGSSFVPSVPFRSNPGLVTVEALQSSEAEAQRVVQLVQDAFREDPEQSVAILVRGRSHLKHILPALKQAGIGASGTDIDPIAECAPVAEVVAMIRSLWHQADRTSWLALLRAAFVGLSWEDCLTVSMGHEVIPVALRMSDVQERLTLDGKARVNRLVEALDGVEKSSRSDELAWKARALWLALGGMSTVDQTELADIKTVFKLLGTHTATGDLDNPQEFFNALTNLYASPKAGVVQIMTIHKSKGLEFGTVIIPALQKSGGSDDTPLFYWRTINGRFFMAPNMGDQDAMSPESRLFKFLGSRVKADHRDELERVAYVGFTRAKSRLHLTACKDVENEDAGASNSLLGSLKRVLADEFVEADVDVIELDVAGGVPSKARLDAGHSVELPTDCFIPAATNEALPTESELHDELREGEGDDHKAKVEGIVYHRVVEMIAKDGLETWSIDKLQGKAQAVAALMRREGYPIRDIPTGRDRIMKLLVTTLQSEKGRWILSKHDEGGQEVQVSGFRNGRWVHRYLDRPFVDAGAYWITDWKTGDCPEGVEVEAFLAAIAARYRKKMEEYRAVVIEAGVTLPVKLGLYLPAVDRFVEL
ncbi:UvrD-helicase domain-containing protein [Pseudomonas aeruginosa]|nr:UvrD-helicase domain-containing protein [Pseudomonas aeruginosa]MCV4064247.1 UvrD-helicase domain-containing protein [Pseudomonas aeruginosa]MCV4078985.1 UvrD-helicase domain-containing protein [Pseudomonas aeruginosa]MCV4150891.1 UvrD-helicase domain-containing protein [Pseudomonas aeruginosa]MCV4181305.1 UvrD-helicase domain-containing protein [Pseudomonas aeruginosa]MCV4221602.1 UvrD-helicase domain-containing protein [Pseudomonas aeruginosa]